MKRRNSYQVLLNEHAMPPNKNETHENFPLNDHLLHRHAKTLGVIERELDLQDVSPSSKNGALLLTSIFWGDCILHVLK